MTTQSLVVLALAAIAIAGCQPNDADIANGDDPLLALTVPHRSDRYTTSYWTQKSVSDADLWRRAVEYCEGKTEGDHPNCDAVRYVDMIEKRSRLPADRPDTFGLTVPQATTRDTTSR
jgi:hypothetical protein